MGGFSARSTGSRRPHDGGLTIARSRAQLHGWLGRSGGVFAPSLLRRRHARRRVRRARRQPPAPFVVVGMAAVFAGAARVPIATMMMVTEMTGGYTLLVPAALAVMISYLVQSRLARPLRFLASTRRGDNARRFAGASHEAPRDRTPVAAGARVQRPSSRWRARSRHAAARGNAGGSRGRRRVFAGELLVDESVRRRRRSRRAVAELAGVDTNVIGIIRGEENDFADRPIGVDARDRIILVADDDSREVLRTHLAPW